MDSLRLAGVVRESIVDGPGLRFTLFCQGCPHNCPGCHNPQTHDFAGGSDVTIDKLVAEIKKNPLLSGVSFSGGEPFCQAEGFFELAKRLKAETELDIVSYSGYTYEQLLEMSAENAGIAGLLGIIDYLIDGPYIAAERDLTLQFRGSGNQRYIDMRATREKGKLVLAS